MSILRYRLEQRLSGVAGVPSQSVERVAGEVLDLFGQTLDDFITARHSELQQEGYSTTAIYRHIQSEIEEWRFKAPPLSLRQIRRRIYG